MHLYIYIIKDEMDSRASCSFNKRRNTHDSVCVAACWKRFLCHDECRMNVDRIVNYRDAGHLFRLRAAYFLIFIHSKRARFTAVFVFNYKKL